MAKSFKDYDKITAGDKVVKLFKVFGIAVGGTIIGSIPAIVLLCGFNIFTAALYVLGGALGMVFYGLYFKKEERKFYDHPLLILGTAVGLFITQFFEFVVHYSPSIVIEGSNLNYVQLAFYTYFQHAKFDQLTAEGLITADGTLSVYTWYFASLIVAIIGIYVAFLFVLATDREESRGKNKR